MALIPDISEDQWKRTRDRVFSECPEDHVPEMYFILRLVAWLKNRGVTQQQIGEAMGYRGETARKAVNQFLRSSDPRISTVRKFCTAVGIPMKFVFAEVTK